MTPDLDSGLARFHLTSFTRDQLLGGLKAVYSQDKRANQIALVAHEDTWYDLVGDLANTDREFDTLNDTVFVNRRLFGCSIVFDPDYPRGALMYVSDGKPALCLEVDE